MKKKAYLTISATLSITLCNSVSPGFAWAAESFNLLNSSLKMIWGLLVVLGILLIIYGLIKKRVTLLQGGSKGVIKVIESRHLVPKKSLFLVEVRGKEYLLGSGADSLTLIAALDNKDHASPEFKSILKDTEQGRSA